MLRSANLLVILGVCGVCPLTLSASLQYSSSSVSSPTDYIKLSSSDFSGEGKSISELRLLPPPAEPGKWYNLSATITEVLAVQRAKIASEFNDFDFASCDACGAGTSLADLIPEKGGRPVHSIVVSTWRSGSTFTADIINAMPGNYYFFEPLMNFGVKSMRTDENQQFAIRNLKKLLNCDYSDMEDYLDFGKNHLYQFEHNERLWSVCMEFPQFCWRADFLSAFCKLFPMQIMKTARLRLNTAERLLADESLNLRIMLLVRDPRGTMLSRRGHEWCNFHPDCDAANHLCDDLVADFESAEILLKKYPTRFRTLRYEDLSVNPYEVTQEILKFYGVPYDPAVKHFLDTHTKADIGDVFTTYRDSKSTPFHWIQDSSIVDLKHIQKHCANAMELWGYRKIENFTDYQHTFDPIIQPAPLTTLNS